MEYRLKYRDIPWPVAIGVLPGKIIGTFFIKPWIDFERGWKRKLKHLGSIVLTMLAVLLIALMICILVNEVLDDKLFNAVLNAQQQSQPAAPPAPAPIDMGLQR